MGSISGLEQFAGCVRADLHTPSLLCTQQCRLGSLSPIAWKLTNATNQKFAFFFSFLILRAGFTLLPAVPLDESAMLRTGKWTLQSGSTRTEPPPHLDCLLMGGHTDETHLPPHFSHHLGSVTAAPSLEF